MNLEALRLAVCVADSGSFAAAARLADLDPSSVSRSVASLEAELGIRLFHRSTRRLSLTEEGGAYLARVAPLLEEFDRARDAAREGRARPGGTLRLTASVAFGTECIVPHLPRYRDLYPEIALDLVLTDGNLDLVTESLDLAIRLAPAPGGDLISTRLMTTRYRVCAAPAWIDEVGAPSTPQALGAVPCLLQGLPEYRDRWRFRPAEGGSAAGEVDVPISGPVVISNPLALREAARRGLGPALLADWLVDGDLAAGALVDLFPSHAATATGFDTAAWALYPSRSYLPAKVRVTIDFLRTVLPRRILPAR